MNPLFLRFRKKSYDLSQRTLIMGALNVTPDSFSDGGHFFDREKAIEEGLRLAQGGADILDIGGESTRPGAKPLDAEEEIRRVIPLIRDLGSEDWHPDLRGYAEGTRSGKGLGNRGGNDQRH